jgi:hypothetical protein
VQVDRAPPDTRKALSAKASSPAAKVSDENTERCNALNALLLYESKIHNRNWRAGPRRASAWLWTNALPSVRSMASQ